MMVDTRVVASVVEGESIGAATDVRVRGSSEMVGAPDLAGLNSYEYVFSQPNQLADPLGWYPWTKIWELWRCNNYCFFRATLELRKVKWWQVWKTGRSQKILRQHRACIYSCANEEVCYETVSPRTPPPQSFDPWP